MTRRYIDMALVVLAVAAIVFGFVFGEFGLVLGLIAALFTVRLLFNLFFAQRRRGPSTKLAGSLPCPSCGALQTDKFSEPQADGSDRERWRCFACDHLWD